MIPPASRQRPGCAANCAVVRAKLVRSLCRTVACDMAFARPQPWHQGTERADQAANLDAWSRSHVACGSRPRRTSMSPRSAANAHEIVRSRSSCLTQCASPLLQN